MRLHIAYDHPIAINAFEWTPATYRQPPRVHASLEIGLCLTGKGYFSLATNNMQLILATYSWSIMKNGILPNLPQTTRAVIYLLILIPRCCWRKSQVFCCHSPITPLILQSYYGRLAARQTTYALGAGYSGRTAGEVPGYLAMAKSALIQLCGRLLRHYDGLLTDDERHHMVRSVREVQSLAALVEHRYHEPVSLGNWLMNLV